MKQAVVIGEAAEYDLPRMGEIRRAAFEPVFASFRHAARTARPGSLQRYQAFGCAAGCELTGCGVCKGIMQL